MSATESKIPSAEHISSVIQRYGDEQVSAVMRKAIAEAAKVRLDLYKRINHIISKHLSNLKVPYARARVINVGRDPITITECQILKEIYDLGNATCIHNFCAIGFDKNEYYELVLESKETVEERNKKQLELQEQERKKKITELEEQLKVLKAHTEPENLQM